VATSLSEGESIDKKVGILEVCGKTFNMKPVKLKTVRPFVFFSMNVDDYVEDKRLNEGDTRAKVEKIYETKINEMIEEAKAKLTGHPKQPKLPLIRLRVINTARFG